MTDDLKQPIPVAGYKPQSDASIALVNEFKAVEERLLRKLDRMTNRRETGEGHAHDVYVPPTGYDQRWLAIARSHFEQGFMALNRSVFQPGRVKLPEDDINV